jgi:hypothetical protein
MKLLLAAAVLALSIPVIAEDTKLGTGVTLKDSTPIGKVTAKPADYVGKTIRVDGVATAVCTHMGCWMAIAPEGQPDAPTVRLKVEDGVIVFPVSAKGKKVSAEGLFEEVKGEENKEAAGEHAKKDPKASKEYQIKATGAVIR